MITRPERTAAAPQSFAYIDLIPGNDPLGFLEKQLPDCLTLFKGISEEKSQYRYAPEKWSIRQLLNHVTDTERAFAYRTLWFARGFTDPLIGIDETIAAAGAEAHDVSFSAHVAEFEQVRRSTISLFRNMPASGWKREGVVSGNRVTVPALAYLIPGHVEHHMNILRDRYLR
jgi:hypothetical protein